MTVVIHLSATVVDWEFASILQLWAVYTVLPLLEDFWDRKELDLEQNSTTVAQAMGDE
jgi:hypothetical protein